MNNENTTNTGQLKKESLRVRIISDLHKIFCEEYVSGDMEMTQALMNAVIKHHGLKFLEPQEIDTCFFLLDVSDIESSFYEAVNSQRCLDLPYFAIQCEAYIDFTQAIRKDNEARYGAFAMFHMIIVKGKEQQAGDGKMSA